MKLPERDLDGKLPAYAWPGGYPIFYLALDNGVLCPKCANKYKRGRDTEKSLKPVAADVNYEDPSLYCENCDAKIECAYCEDSENPYRLGTRRVYPVKGKTASRKRTFQSKKTALRMSRNGNGPKPIGQAVEVRYKRTGRKPGFYKHTMETRAQVYTVPAGWFYVPAKSIVIASSIRGKN